MRMMMLMLLLSLPLWAGDLTLRLGGPVRFGGTVERTADGRVWLRTPQGERVLVNNELGFTNADQQLLEFHTLASGIPVNAELAAGELRLIAVDGPVVTLLGPGGPVQVPLQGLAGQARSDTPVSLQRNDGTTVTVSLAEALREQAAGRGRLVLPEVGLARVETARGPVLVNLKPELPFLQPMRIVGTLGQIRGGAFHMVARISGDSLAAPPALCSPLHPNHGDTVTVDIPAGSYQLLGMFGKQAQLKTPVGVLQLPFRLLPENVLQGTQVWVRTYGGELRDLSLAEALRLEKTESYMLLLPGAPGINPSEVSGFYEIPK